LADKNLPFEKAESTSIETDIFFKNAVDGSKCFYSHQQINQQTPFNGEGEIYAEGETFKRICRSFQKERLRRKRPFESSIGHASAPGQEQSSARIQT